MASGHAEKLLSAMFFRAGQLPVRDAQNQIQQRRTDFLHGFTLRQDRAGVKVKVLTQLLVHFVIARHLDHRRDRVSRRIAAARRKADDL